MTDYYQEIAKYGGIGKGEPRKRRKGREKRRESTVAEAVRAECVERDGYCRYGDRTDCDGPSEWAHLEDKKRARTRGQAPEVRHTTEKSMMLCHRHHALYDAGTLHIRLYSDKGANGAVSIYRPGDVFL